MIETDQFRYDLYWYSIINSILIKFRKLLIKRAESKSDLSIYECISDLNKYAMRKGYEYEKVKEVVLGIDLKEILE